METSYKTEELAELMGVPIASFQKDRKRYETKLLKYTTFRKEGRGAKTIYFLPSDIKVQNDRADQMISDLLDFKSTRLKSVFRLIYFIKYNSAEDLGFLDTDHAIAKKVGDSRGNICTAKNELIKNGYLICLEEKIYKREIGEEEWLETDSLTWKEFWQVYYKRYNEILYDPACLQNIVSDLTDQNQIQNVAKLLSKKEAEEHFNYEVKKLLVKSLTYKMVELLEQLGDEFFRNLKL